MIGGGNPITFVCARCGSTDVSRDAWAEWDVAGQSWVLKAAFDHARCHACDRPTDLETREIERAG